MNVIHLTALAGSLAASQPSPNQQVPVTPPQNEVSQSALLAQILPKLKRTLRDPYSIRDFSLCAPRGLKLKGGRPDRWSAFFSFNAKNAMGGYAGLQTWVAVFREGRLSGQLIPTQVQVSEGLMGVLNRKLQRELESCTAVPDEHVQAVLSGTQVSL